MKLDKEPCDGIKVHIMVIVGGAQTFEKSRGDGEEGHVLDIWIVLRRVGHYVMDVVIAFPPAD